MIDWLEYTGLNSTAITLAKDATISHTGSQEIRNRDLSLFLFFIFFIIEVYAS